MWSSAIRRASPPTKRPTGMLNRAIVRTRSRVSHTLMDQPNKRREERRGRVGRGNERGESRDKLDT